MKKILRKTGEIVDVISYNNLLGAYRSSLDSVSYIDSKGNECVKVEGLNLAWDFENVEERLSTDIDWEHLRIKAAVSALQGFASNPNITSVTYEDLAKWSVSCADALIAELKKGGNNEKH